ncbi:MAG TPA: fimbria/pilus periplasmic chaperone [Burkholderiales bacterium]|nr:fimbria/pilus periplasmic chaperone [Burkholderiales bacterium]
MPSRPITHVLGYIAACALCVLMPAASIAGLFSISPIRLDLNRQNKTDSITISNDEPERKIEMQAKLVEWTQDAKGNDVYVESNDLVFFPRIFSVDKQDQRVVRVGLKVPAAATEKSYRLFVEELPPPPDPDKKGAQILFVLRFGVPIFVRPDTEQLAGSIEGVEFAPAAAMVVIRNTGNQNFQIQSLSVKSQAGYEKEIVGGYVLAGATKHVAAPFPADMCAKIGKLQIIMKTDRIGTIERTFDWDASRCGAK